MPVSVSFREKLEKSAPISVVIPSPSGSSTHAILRRVAPLHRPVSAAETLVGLGLSLRKAHAILNCLAAGEDVVVTLPAAGNMELAGRMLLRLGIAVEW